MQMLFDEGDDDEGDVDGDVNKQYEKLLKLY